MTGPTSPHEQSKNNTVLVVPDVGAGEAVLQLCCWLVEEGERVTGGEDVAEILMHGVTFNIAATTTGVLRQIRVRPNQRVQTGDVLGWIETSPEEGARAERTDKTAREETTEEEFFEEEVSEKEISSRDSLSSVSGTLRPQDCLPTEPSR